MKVLIFVIAFIIACVLGFSSRAMVYWDRERVKAGEAIMNGNIPAILAGALIAFPCLAVMLACDICGIDNAGIKIWGVFYGLYYLIALAPWVVCAPFCVRAIKRMRIFGKLLLRKIRNRATAKL